MIRSIPLALCAILGFSVSALRAQDTFLGKSPDAWIAQLKIGADAKQRRNAAFALGKMANRPASAVTALKEALGQEKDAKVRDAIVFGLGEIAKDTKANADLEPLFLAAIKDQDVHVRRSAAFALGCVATKSAATRAALEAALGDPEPMVRQNAAFALAQFKEEALPALKKALGDDDSLVKRDAASVLLLMEDGDKVHDYLDDLLPLCKDANSETRRAALNVLMRIVDSGDKKAIPALRWALDDRDNENKRNAAFALGKIGGAETAVAVPALLQAAKDGDLETRRLTIMVIRNIGPAAADAVPELVRYLREDKDEGVRIAAAVALGGLGKSAVPAINALVERIGDSAETRDVRMECCMAMSRMGSNPDTMNVAPTLLGILGDSRHDARVREKVWWTLKVHGGNLNKVKGCFETFSAVCKEAPSVENKMLRYNCAYLLGMIWQHDAPDQTLVVLSEFLQDKSIQIFDSVQFKSGVIKVDEGKGGEKGEVKIKGKGDGRVMACDALKMIGPDRYAKRQEIMNQLRLLANDATIYQPLREKSAELHKAGQ